MQSSRFYYTFTHMYVTILLCFHSSPSPVFFSHLSSVFACLWTSSVKMIMGALNLLQFFKLIFSHVYVESTFEFGMQNVLF